MESWEISMGLLVTFHEIFHKIGAGEAAKQVGNPKCCRKGAEYYQQILSSDGKQFGIIGVGSVKKQAYYGLGN